MDNTAHPHGHSENIAAGSNSVRGGALDNIGSTTNNPAGSSAIPGPTPSGNSTGQTHAKDGGNDSIVPKAIQKIVPESVERVLPNAIHNTGDTSGAHRST